MDFDRFVLAAATADLDEEPAAREHADAVEFRMDLAADPLAQLRDYGGDLPLIVTNRAGWEGGGADDDPARLAALETAVEQPAVGAVDIELAALEGRESDTGAARAVRARAREHGVTVVASVHDFEGTPGREGMTELLGRAGEHGDLAKLAVTAGTPADVLDLLAVTWAAGRGARVATMAMGEPGRHSRAVAPLYGSCLGYAPVNPAGATAPGQYDLATLAGLVEALGVRRAED